ncbi:hypothetical protein [Streptomyces sp. SM10]|uniref:hypothetical protein n=1 Tax=Streptomyces sp. SM10 TaxID=565556 RepID=UPI000CDAA305|nr:hypothetical protein [Streptomyces sp. SM10]
MVLDSGGQFGTRQLAFLPGAARPAVHPVVGRQVKGCGAAHAGASIAGVHQSAHGVGRAGTASGHGRISVLPARLAVRHGHEEGAGEDGTMNDWARLRRVPLVSRRWPS